MIYSEPQEFTGDRSCVTRGNQWFFSRDPATIGLTTDASLVYGDPGDVHVLGDWDGDGTATPGVFRDGVWYLRNSLSSGVADIEFRFGNPGDAPVVGDWDGDGVATIGVFDPSGQFGQKPATWYLRNRNSPGAPSYAPFAYGTAAFQPVVGDWDGPPLALRAAGAASGQGSLSALSDEEAGAMLRAAVERLSAAGIVPPEARVGVRDLPAGYLALAHRGAGLIEVDDDAAGRGWFVDPTPLADEEFTADGRGLPGSEAAGREDLLTVLLHELGHLAGLPDEEGLMAGVLSAGTRHTEALDHLFGATASG